jgi:hypothetical protein
MLKMKDEPTMCMKTHGPGKNAEGKRDCFRGDPGKEFAGAIEISGNS